MLSCSGRREHRAVCESEAANLGGISAYQIQPLLLQSYRCHPFVTQSSSLCLTCFTELSSGIR